jgi:soluble lytic murein transglycosylase
VAAYSEQLGFIESAIEYYESMALAYPDHEDASEALFRAGYLAHGAGDDQRATGIWEQAVANHINAPYGAASLIWLFRIGGIEPEGFIEQAQKVPGSDFYQLRARHIAGNTDPFEAVASVNLRITEEEQFQAEEWLRAQLGLEPTADIGTLLPELAQDGRLTRGQKLLQLGRWQEAKVELESLRWSFNDNMLASYQLALIFRDLGLYRSSILAALSVLRLAETDVLESPAFIGKLAYPIYYSELVEEQAAHYGFDPLLQFALIRQESLFESFAKSSAVAQGLSQVIPDTGAYIAQRLEWPDYQNEDLYKPYVGIAFGAYYLDQQLDSFNNDVAAALSAYNAGPGNAARWYDQASHDIDLMREIVNFSETQQYIDRIYEGHAIYSYLYGQE